MLEFYWAYADVNEMMDFCEEMLRVGCQRSDSVRLHGSLRRARDRFLSNRFSG